MIRKHSVPSNPPPPHNPYTHVCICMRLVCQTVGGPSVCAFWRERERESARACARGENVGGLVLLQVLAHGPEVSHSEDTGIPWYPVRILHPATTITTVSCSSSEPPLPHTHSYLFPQSTSQFTALALNKPSSSESTSQFTASALNKLSSSSSSSSESTSQFTASALNKLSSSSSSSSPPAPP